MEQLRETLSNSLIERDEEIEAILLGLIAQEHVLLVGPPGTAKSHLCRSVAAGIDGCRYVERLLSPTTPPEAIFGPVSLSALRQDRYEHVRDGSVTDAELVFLDEFFRGSDAIRDSLLHLLGPERQCLVGTEQVQSPLVSAVGAANSWADGASQAAIMDRWLIRRAVRPVSSRGRDRLLYDDFPAVTPVVTLQDVQYAQGKASVTRMSDKAKDVLGIILAQLQDKGIRPSDRRCRQSLKVARAKAVLDGDDQVEPRHLLPLQDVLWDVPDEQPKEVAAIVGAIADPAGTTADQLLASADEIVQEAKESADKVAALKKLDNISRELDELQASSRVDRARDFVVNERIQIQAGLLGIDPAKAKAMMEATT